MEYLPAVAGVILIAIVAVVVTISKRKHAQKIVATWVPAEAAVISIDHRRMERREREVDREHQPLLLNVRYELNGKSYDSILRLNYWTVRRNFPELVTIQSKVEGALSVFEVAKEVIALSKRMDAEGASKDEINEAVKELTAAKGTQYNTIIPVLVNPESPRIVEVDPTRVEERNGGLGMKLGEV